MIILTNQYKRFLNSLVQLRWPARHTREDDAHIELFIWYILYFDGDIFRVAHLSNFAFFCVCVANSDLMASTKLPTNAWYSPPIIFYQENKSATTLYPKVDWTTTVWCKQLNVSFKICGCLRYLSIHHFFILGSLHQKILKWFLLDIKGNDHSKSKITFQFPQIF